jgi:ribosomal protein S12 methylthiotransferase
MPLFSLVNLGCSKNIIDGERIVHLVKKSGYALTRDLSRADLIIVNTCAFIREAQEEAIENILYAAQVKKDASTRLVVSGCFSERFRAQVQSEFPEVDLWVGINDWEDVLGRLLDVTPYPIGRVLSGPRATQHIKIADGCSHRCSFCVIPAIRGPYKSRPPRAILDEALWLESQGVRELILVAQDTSWYGKDIGLSLIPLLEEVVASTSIPWIRLMYLHPQFISADLLKLCAGEPRICSYFDIPLQHIADPLLRSMRRKPDAKGIYRLIERIRTMVPDAAIRSAFIAGYPGETESHFRELIRFIEWARFEKLGVFPYSPEEGTPAVSLRPRPRNSTALRRSETLMTVQRDISREINERKIGSVIEVIIDRVADDPDFNFEARSRFDAPEVDGKVLLRNGSFKPGTITGVTVIGSSDYDLYAEVPA